jgi:tRNA (guanosine-2'-O-)-methyltransferase
VPDDRRGGFDRPTLEGMIRPDRREKLLGVLRQRLNSPAVVLEDVWDPHNIGAVLRTVEGLGLHRVFVIEANSTYEPRSQVTQGAHKWLDVRRHPSVEACVADTRALGYRLLVTRMDAPDTLDDLDWSIPTAVVMGNEKDGVTPGLAALADGAFRIPMAGFSQSFNISVATAMIVSQAALWLRRHPEACRHLEDVELAERELDYLYLSLPVSLRDHLEGDDPRPDVSGSAPN